MTPLPAPSSVAVRRAFLAAAVAGALFGAQGCGIFGFTAKVAEAIESEKQLLIPAQYIGLENKTVAVVVNADRTILYEYPTVVPQIVNGIASGIKVKVQGADVLSPAVSMGWAFRTPTWHTMPLGDVAKELNVDRVVVVDLYEFRLNPPGNRWTWEGVAAANVGIIERDSLDPDSFAEEYSVRVNFPEEQHLSRESEPEAKIQFGLYTKFAQTVNKLFYKHLVPKHPDQKI